MYLQVTVDESVDLWHALMIDSSQNNYEENHHKSWKSPTQKEKQQISPLCVFIVHHQHIPEIHRLRKETEHKMNKFWSNGIGHKLTWLGHKELQTNKGLALLNNYLSIYLFFTYFLVSSHTHSFIHSRKSGYLKNLETLNNIYCTFYFP